jgi:RNA polymerase sigma-70 factor (ECF subfamily)
MALDFGSPGSGEAAFSPEQLLAHAPFVRALARALVRDDAAADDLAQESLLAALTRPPQRGSLRAWLVGVVRNLARRTKRSDERRLARENTVALARPPPPATPSETAERLELFGRLVAAVSRLDEPYRATIVRRFFDDATAQVIATEQGIPVDTVRTRIRRGLERLRVMLDETAGGRAAWSALLAPWVAFPAKIAATAAGVAATTTSSTILGAVVMTTKMKLLLAAAVLVATTTVVLWPVLRSGRTRDATTSARTAPAPSESNSSPAPAAAAESSAAPPLAVERSADSSSTPPSDPTATWVVQGRVRAAQDRPRPHAHVRAKLWEGYEQLGAPRVDRLLAADDAGHFAWPLRPPSTAVVLSLRAEEPDSYAWSDERFVLAGDPPPQDFDLPCYPLDGEITGVVFGPDGAPAEGAQVSVVWRTVDCDEHGEYSAPAPRLPQVYVIAWAPGCAESKILATTVGSGAPTRVDVHLKPSLLVRGRVRDAQGNAIAGATVSNFFLQISKAVSDEHGDYSLDHLPASESRVQLFARAEGYCQSTGEVGEGGTLDFVMRRGATVSGTVLAPDGTPARGASIVLGFSPFAYDKLEARAHDDGGFTIAGAAPGGSKLFIEWRGAAQHVEPVVVPPDGGDLTGLVLRLQANHFLAGRVIDSRGQPVARVNVSCQSRDDDHGSHAVSDAKGAFRVEQLPAGPLKVEVYGRGYGRSVIEGVAVDRDDFEATVSPAGRAAGRVVDGTTGEPIARFRVRFVNPRLADGEQRASFYSSAWAEAGRTFDDPNGRFDTGDEMMDCGAVLGLEVSAEGYAPALADHVVLAAAPDPDALVIRLHRGGALEGIVVDAGDGKPVVGALVKFVNEAMPIYPGFDSFASSRPVVRTDAGGRFKIDRVAAGSCRLMVEHADYARAIDGPIDVPREGSPTPRTIRLDAGGAIDGVTLAADGRPIADATIRLYGNQDGASTGGTDAMILLVTKSDASGRFSFLHLPPGRTQISREVAEGLHTVQEITRFVQVEAGKTCALRLAPAGRATVRGRLHAAALPNQAIVVDLHPAGAFAPDAGTGDSACSMSTFAHDGVFEFTGVEPGKAQLSARSAEFRQGEIWFGNAEVEVAEGATVEVTLELAKSK